MFAPSPIERDIELRVDHFSDIAQLDLRHSVLHGKLQQLQAAVRVLASTDVDESTYRCPLQSATA